MIYLCFIQPFIQRTLSTYYELGTLLGLEDTAVNETRKPLHPLDSRGEDR